MGYTHFWTPKATTEIQFKEFAKVCKNLYQNLDKEIKICGGNGEGKPLFRNDEVWFNGDKENDLYHETFCIDINELEWAFCKTARKPYDLLVCACLIAAHEILDYEVTSDGDLEDWSDAIKFYSETIHNGNEDKMKLPEFLIK